MSRAAALPAARSATRWIQLLLGLICMMAISSPQYVWTLFVKPFGTALTAGPAAIQVTFSLLIVLQTFFSPFQGYLVDRFGPRLLIASGAVLTGLSWVLAASASSLTGLYVTYGLVGGLGTGIVYVGVVGLMVGWFPDRRGFAAGVVAAGYGTTLIPALAAGAAEDAGIILRPLTTKASRTIRIAWRAHFPGTAAVHAVGEIIATRLRNFAEGAAGGVV